MVEGDRKQVCVCGFSVSHFLRILLAFSESATSIKPRKFGLIEVADSEKANNMRKKCDTEKPQTPSLLAVAFHNLPCSSQSAETLGDHENKANKCKESSGFCLGNKLIARIPHIESPVTHLVTSDQPPIAKMPDARVDEHGSVIAGMPAIRSTWSIKNQNRRFHNKVHGDKPNYQAPAKRAHLFAKWPQTQSQYNGQVCQKGGA